MVTTQVCPDESKRPETARELTNCDALNGGEEFIQRPLEKPRPSTTSKRIRPNHRDKESLLDELLELKNAIVDQAFHMKLHIQHHGQVQEKNKQLQRDVENLELAYGLEAPRVGGENKLTAKLLGLKARLREKQGICNSRDVEICLLRKDLRVTHCRELEIERDLFAKEVGTLQKSIRGLRRIFVKVNSENDELQRIRQRISKLESANKELRSKIQSTQKAIGDAKTEIGELASQSSAAQASTRAANSKLIELENHSQELAKLKHQEECERLRLEHSILKTGDETRQILKDKIAAEKQALYNAQASAETPPSQTKKFKFPEQPPESPSGDAMAQLEAEFIAEVETAAVEFIETVPASQPPSPKSEAQLKEQHVTFENRKDFFTEKVEDAEIRFLMAMEEIEYGKARTKQGQSLAKRLAAAEKARLAAEKERQAAEALAKQFAEDAKKAREEAARLQAELEKLRAMGAGDKRWKSEKVTVTVGEDVLKPVDYTVQVLDKGAEIDIDVDIAMAGGASTSSPDENLKKLDELNKAKAKAEAEAKRLEEAMRKAQEERDRLAAELAKLQSMGAGGKRWKNEIVSVVMGAKALSTDEYKLTVLDKGSQIDIDVHIQGITNKIEGELAKVKAIAGETQKSLLDDESSRIIKTNIQEVLQHLETISAVIKPTGGPSKHDVSSSSGE